MPDTKTYLAVTLSVHTDDTAAAMKAAEALILAAVGLAMDGMWASVSIQQMEEEDV